MSKKWFYGIIIVLILLVFILGKMFGGSKPFQTLDANEIQAISVKLIPPGETFVLSETEIQELVSLLNDVVVYHEDDSFHEYAGQGVIFTIIRNNGLKTTVNANNPFIVINNIGYQVKYTTCEKLSQFANGLRNN